MKTLLLTGIAVLLLATPAHARSYEAFHCGKYVLQALAGKYFYAPTGCTRNCDHKPHWVIYGKRGVVDHWVREKNERVYYKGKECRPFTEEEYNQVESADSKRSISDPKPPEPWDEGWTASQAGKPMDANPYPTGSPMFEGWDRGWRAQDTAKKQGQ